MCGPALFLYGFLFNSVRGRINAQLRRARAKARGAPVWTPPQDLLWIVALSAGTVMRRRCRFLCCTNGIGRPMCPNSMQSRAMFGSDASSKGHERCAR